VRGNPHARFGRRLGETDRSKHRDRAPSRPHLGLKAMEETRRRVQQELLGHPGRKHDPLYRIRNALRAGADRLTARQIERIEAGLNAGDPHFEVTIAWRCYSSSGQRSLRRTLPRAK
jgi:Transposase